MRGVAPGGTGWCLASRPWTGAKSGEESSNWRARLRNVEFDRPERARTIVLDLFFDELGEHSPRVDGNEESAAAGKHLPFGIENLRHVGMLPPAYTNLPRFHTQRLIQWHRFQIIYRHLRCQRDYLA